MRNSKRVSWLLLVFALGCGGGGKSPKGSGSGGSGGGTGAAGAQAGSGGTPAGAGGAAGGAQTGAAGSTPAGAGGSGGATGVAGTGGPGGAGGPGGGQGTDGGTAGTGAPSDGGVGGAKGTGTCGTEKPDLTGLTGSEGLVIDADGTLYFSQPMAVGRLRPGAASKPEKAWAKLTGAGTVWGLAIDKAQKALFAGSPSTLKIYKITLEDTPTVTDYLTMAGQPNGLTIGPDGALYYTDFQNMGNVFRVAAAGARTMVTTTVIPMPNGLAFGPDGALYVDVFAMGAILKLTLTAGAETARATYVAMGMVAAADGLAFDAAGNAYVGFGGGVSRISPDGKTITNVVKGGAANVEFGAGALDCKDIYYVTGGKLARVANDTAGAAVPWHVN
jgi:sugar lactone lactonase YvrE